MISEFGPSRLSLDLNPPDPFRKTMFLMTKNAIESFIGLPQLNHLYEEAQNQNSSSHFSQKVMNALNCSVEITREDLSRIPAKGRLVVIANHPFGGIEGMILAKILFSVRPDVKIMMNYFLSQVHELEDFAIYVDPFGAKSSAQKNFRPLKQALKWLENEGCVVIFPAGEVSHWQMRQNEVADPEWSDTLAGIVRRTGSIDQHLRACRRQAEDGY